MTHGTIIAIEDDLEIAQMLKLYFLALGYNLRVVGTGQQGISSVTQSLPDLVLLDLNLPDMDGLSVFRELKANNRTDRVPVIFLTQKDNKADRLEGLRMGAVDYLTKPFDIEELRLRVERIIERSQQQNLVNPRTELPGRRLLQEQVRNRSASTDWALLNCSLNYYREFADHYGVVASNEALRVAARIIREALGAEDQGDFISHPEDDEFIVIISHRVRAEPLAAHITTQFNREITSHYSFEEREQGYIVQPTGSGGERRVPLMNMTVTITHPHPTAPQE